MNEKTKNLCKLSSEGRLAHSVLLETGDVIKEGLKTANCIAKAFICLAEKNRPCNKCVACRKIDLGSHPDVNIITVKPGYKSIRVDDIRNLRLDAYLSPNEAKYKVYIISDGGLMNEPSQNVFLKILEEPPEKVKFIIICQSRFLMLPTIRSRTQIFTISDEHTEKSSAKIKETIKEILNAASEESDFSILKVTAGLAKNKENFGKIIKEMEYIVSEMCIKREKKEIFEEYSEFSKISIKKLLQIRDIVEETKNLINKNINNQLAVCKFCIGLGRL